MRFLKPRPRYGLWKIGKMGPVILDPKKNADPSITTISKPEHKQVVVKLLWWKAAEWNAGGVWQLNPSYKFSISWMKPGDYTQTKETKNIQNVGAVNVTGLKCWICSDWSTLCKWVEKTIQSANCASIKRLKHWNKLIAYLIVTQY